MTTPYPRKRKATSNYVAMDLEEDFNSKTKITENKERKKGKISKIKKKTPKGERKSARRPLKNRNRTLQKKQQHRGKREGV